MASYSDDFNRASLGADWENVAPGGTWSIVSNRVRCAAATTPTTLLSVLRYTTALDTQEHFSQIDYTGTNDTFFWLGPAINITGGQNTAYTGVSREASSLSRIYELDNSSETVLISGSDGTAPPTTLKLQRSGSTLNLFDGETSILEYEIVGTPLSGSHAGISARSNISNTAFTEGDNWSAQDLGAGGTTIDAVGVQNLQNQFSPVIASRLNGWLQ